MQKYFIQTYGCQMNYSDTERMETYLEALGYEKTEKLADANLIIFNTCTVRQKADDRVFGELGKIEKMWRKKKNKPTVVLTGCMTRISSSRYSEKRDKLFNRTKDLDIVLKIDEMQKLASMMREVNPETTIKKIEEEDYEDYFKITPKHTSKAQAFIPISTGCDKFCTYCIVPYSRGREKSRKIQDIVDEAKGLVADGCLEITLVGQTVDSYGVSNHDKQKGTFKDLPKDKLPFVYLLEQLDKLYEKGLKRIRFTSPHPRDISDELIDAIAELQTLQPYLHLPVQAGHNDTLKRMNRPYTIERYIEIIEKLRKTVPGIAISSDIIVGFCDETEEEFQASYDLLKNLEFDHLYISQYSNRPGTYASKNLNDDVPEKTKHERWHKMNDLLREISPRNLKKYIGKTVNVLVEECAEGECTGRSEHYKTVQFPSKKDLTGQIVAVKITDSDVWLLKGEFV